MQRFRIYKTHYKSKIPKITYIYRDYKGIKRGVALVWNGKLIPIVLPINEIINNMPEYKKKLFKILKNDEYGLCPAPMPSHDAIDILTKYLLGEDFYIAMPLNREQSNTSIVYQILMQYSKEFRKDFERVKAEFESNK